MKLFFIAFALAFFSASSVATAAEVDRDVGEIYGSTLAPDLLAPPNGDCSLQVPAVVTNGQVFTATVVYNVPVPAGNRFERFEFKWASKCAAFTEKTELEKAFTPGSGGISGSFEYVVVPGATCIEGEFEAEVKVKGAINCKANAIMTVINP